MSDQIHNLPQSERYPNDLVQYALALKECTFLINSNYYFKPSTCVYIIMCE